MELGTLAEIEKSVAIFLAPPIAVIVSMAFGQYIWRLIQCIAGSRTFRSRGFRLFDKLTVDGDSVIFVGQDLWSTYFEICDCPVHRYLTTPNDRLRFLKIEVPVNTKGVTA